MEGAVTGLRDITDWPVRAGWPHLSTIVRMTRQMHNRICTIEHREYAGHLNCAAQSIGLGRRRGEQSMSIIDAFITSPARCLRVF